MVGPREPADGIASFHIDDAALGDHQDLSEAKRRVFADAVRRSEVFDAHTITARDTREGIARADAVFVAPFLCTQLERQKEECGEESAEGELEENGVSASVAHEKNTFTT